MKKIDLGFLETCTLYKPDRSGPCTREDLEDLLDGDGI